MSVETHPCDSARYLDDDEATPAYMDEAFKTGDPAFITHALRVVARARGMTQIARDAGVKVMRALGLRLTAEVGVA